MNGGQVLFVEVIKMKELTLTLITTIGRRRDSVIMEGGA
jgi:hypothetical protein